MAHRVGLSFYLIIIGTMVDYNLASRGKQIEEGLNMLVGRVDAESTLRKEDMRNLFERIDSMSAEFNQLKLKESTQEHTELNDRLLHIEQQLHQIIEQKNQTLEIANLKNELIQLNETCNSKTEASTLMMETFTGTIEASTLTMEASTLNNERFKSCLELYEKGHRVSGQYDVYPDGMSNPIRVFCDQDTDGGGWTVFQRRKDGSVDFDREWLDYKRGFGDLDGEFWLGNEYLSTLTTTCCSQLRIDMENSIGEQKYAKYNEFQIKSESEKYSLKVGGYSGNVGRDALEDHNGYPFSAKDVDNDEWTDGNCALRITGAWWYTYCRIVNLNGLYHDDRRLDRDIYWYGFHDHRLTFTEMKFRRLV